MACVSSDVSIHASRMVVRTIHGKSGNFEVNVGMHKGSALSLLLFVIVTEAVSTLSVKKGSHYNLPITLSDVDQFSKFFQRQIRW